MAARQLILDLLARDKTGPATKSAADHLEDVGDAAEDAAKATEKLGKESDKAEDEVEKFGRSSRTAAQHVERLDREIESCERELKQLAVAFAEADTAADRADLSKTIRRTQRDMKELQKNRDVLGGLLPKPAALIGPLAEAGTSAGSQFLQKFSEMATKAGPLGAIGAGIGVALALGIGATVSAAVIGGAGVGGVLGGLMIAKRDSRVQSAAKSLGEEVMTTLEKSAGAFVPAALQGIEQVRESFRRVNKDLTSIFNASSRYVKPLITGLTGLIENVVDGAEKAVQAAGPVIDAISEHLPRLGDAIGDIFADLADNGPEAALALGQLFDVMEFGIRTAGALVNVLTEVYGVVAAALGGPKTILEYASLKTAQEAGAKSGKEFASSQQVLADKTESAAEAAKEQEDAIREANEAMRATIDPLFGFLDAQERVAEAQKKHTDAVKKYGPASKEATAASRELAGAALDLKDRASEVGVTADGKMTPALRRIMQQAGLTKGEIRGVERQMAAARGELDKYDGINARATVSLEVKTAIEKAKAIQAELNKIKSKTVRVNVERTGEITYGSGGGRQAPMTGRAVGGPVRAGTPYIVGEKRPEVFVPDTNGKIVPSVGQYQASMGGGMQALAVTPSGALDEIERLFLKMVRTRPAFRAALVEYLG